MSGNNFEKIFEFFKDALGFEGNLYLSSLLKFELLLNPNFKRVKKLS
jgi:hypothetical protein